MALFPSGYCSFWQADRQVECAAISPGAAVAMNPDRVPNASDMVPDPASST
jgi:hypothetical protein